MGAEGEAAANVLTGAVIAATVEGDAGTPAPADAPLAHAACLNCKTTLTGAYCASCGQRARIHRSLASLGHDILHGVFHFEGKVWRTLPELFFHPGRLTRRYIDGERAKFVSPMALYLFTAFLMFAVFSFIGGVLPDEDGNSYYNPLTGSWKLDQKQQIEAVDKELAELRAAREAPGVTADQREKIDEKIADAESAREVMQALARGDWASLNEIKKRQDARNGAQSESENNNHVDIGWPALERSFERGLEEVNDNPGLLAYKLKTNGYKFSWALIPLSIPFLWLLFFWRRDIRLYDHAIFVTYSISFMMLLVILLSIAAAADVSGAIWGTVLAFAPPIHMFRQLRGTYGLSRFGAAVRLFFLLIATTIVLSLFAALLVVLGLLD